MDISKYKSTGDFYRDAKVGGFSVPLPMCAGLSQLMQKKGLTFPEAYSLLSEKEKIILAGTTFIYKLDANKLWE